MRTASHWDLGGRNKRVLSVSKLAFSIVIWFQLLDKNNLQIWLVNLNVLFLNNDE
jgi:hypothetical protein